MGRGGGGTRSSRIVLIGLRGSGKSTVGPILGELLELPFHDSDDEIERQEGRSTADLLLSLGHDTFRRIEQRVVLELTRRQSPCVLALGGGAPCDRDVREELGSWRSVLLDCPDEVLEARIEGDGSRPPLTDLSLSEEIASLRDARWPMYISLEPEVVDSSRGSPRDVAGVIRNLVLGETAPGTDSTR